MALSLDYTQFHQVFRADLELPYDQHVNREIESNRKSLGGVLFFDRVLSAMSIPKANKIYPPRDGNVLRELHHSICAAKMTAHQKLSALYYLLLDFDDALSPHSQLSESFAKKTGVPQVYQILMKGLWHMDHLQFALAIDYLAHPSVGPEFADSIITVLVRHSDNNDYTFPLAYYHAHSPVLKTSEAVELLFEALARTSVSQAFFFSRRQPEQMRKLLFEQLIDSVLRNSGNQDAANRGLTLITLPMDTSEEAWFREYLSTGEGRKLKKSMDTLIMRSIATGNHEPAGGKPPGGPWGIVQQGVMQGMGGRVEQ